MHYTLFLRYPEPAPSEITEEKYREGSLSFDAFAKELDTAGVLVSAEMFARSNETVTVRLVDETIRVLDEPASDEGAPIGGVFVIDVGNIDEAIGYAKRVPSISWGPIEVRAATVHFHDGEWHAEEPRPASVV